MPNLAKFTSRIIELSFCLLLFLVPLILTPFNWELFEFNKMLLVYLLGTIITASWAIKMILNKKIIFRRTFWDIPLLIFLATQFLSYLVSISPHTSFWGYYSRFHGGLLSTLTYLLLYWSFVSNLNRQKALKTLRLLLAGSILVGTYGVLQHFGIDAKQWIQDVQNRVFSTLGQPNWLAAYLVAVIPVTWALVFNDQKRKKTYLYSLPYALCSLLFLTLLYTKSRSGLIGFSVAFSVFWGLSLTNFKGKNNVKKSFVTFAFLFLIFTLLVGTPWTPSFSKITSPKNSPQTKTSQTQAPLLISESSDIRKIVWKGALNIWKNNPLFGTGPETFAYSYYWHRPRQHNNVSEWDFLYNKAHNEYLNFLATTGTVGFIGYLSLIISFLTWSLSRLFNFQLVRAKKTSSSKFLEAFPFQIEPDKKKTRPKYFFWLMALLSGYTSLLVTNFFGFSVVVTGLIFFLFPAISVVLDQEPKSFKLKPTPALSSTQKSLIGLVLFLFFLTIGSFFKVWYADFLFAKGEQLGTNGKDDQAVIYLKSAISLRPSEPLFHNSLALPAARLAQLAFTQEEATLSAELADLAVSESDLAINLNPYHLNYWKNRVRVFYALAEINPQYLQDTLESLLQASKIAPTDAKIYYNLGLVYGQLDKLEKAILTLEKTIQLKPNYSDARFALALFYEEENMIKEAIDQLEYILEKINPIHEAAREKLRSF
ncbi:O-antigen ligase family protein [Patescibacteria group bacterium]